MKQAQNKIILWNEASPKKTDLRALAAIIKAGGVLIHPSDTCYGIMALPTQENKERILQLKQRPSVDKWFSIAVSDIAMAHRIVHISADQEQWLRQHTPGRFTIVLPAKEGGTIGIRIPASRSMRRIIQMVGEPVITTSANISGQQPHYSFKELQEHFPLASTDAVADGGERPHILPSTVMDMTVHPPTILREGSGLLGQKHKSNIRMCVVTRERRPLDKLLRLSLVHGQLQINHTAPGRSWYITNDPQIMNLLITKKIGLLQHLIKRALTPEERTRLTQWHDTK